MKQYPDQSFPGNIVLSRIVFHFLIMFPLLMLAGLPLTAQEGRYRNLRIIPENSTPDQIVEIAAEVTPSDRQIAWQKMEVTTFIHFTMNTFYDREWGMGNEDPQRFNPARLDAEQWVRTCKSAGSRCIILTCKHHDGFCLWPSKYTNHTIANSPWKAGKGDIVKELSEACRKEGIGFGIYLSPWDRHEPVYGTDAYNEFFRNQLDELLSNYGPISEVWFDGACGEGLNGKKQVYDWLSYYSLVRKKHPDAVIAIMGPDVRWVGTESGYGRETEWSIVPVQLANLKYIPEDQQQNALEHSFSPLGDMTVADIGSRQKISNAEALVWYPSEVDVSIRPGWFWHSDENDRVKSPEELLNIYYSSIGRNSVLLLNIPPDTSGLIHEMDIQVLQEWTRVRELTFRRNKIDQDAGLLLHNNLSGSISLLTDNLDSTYILFSETGEKSIEFMLQKPASFNVLMLQENIRIGQRIERFRLDGLINGSWKNLCQGSTVGYKRLIRFPLTETDRIRLVIESSRKEPALSEFGLFLQPPKAIATPSSATFTDSIQVTLQADVKDSEIRYTLDGSDPLTEGTIYTQPLNLTRDTKLRYISSLIPGEWGLAGKSEYRRSRIGIRLINEADAKYNGKNPEILADGIAGSMDHGDGRWLGINGKNLHVIIDPGKKVRLEKCSISILELTTSWIFRPEQLRFLISVDGSNFREIRAYSNSCSTGENKMKYVYEADIKEEVRLLKIIATPVLSIPTWHPAAGLPAWIFTDEITITY